MREQEKFRGLEKQGEMEEGLLFEVLVRKAPETSLILGGLPHFHQTSFLIA